MCVKRDRALRIARRQGGIHQRRRPFDPQQMHIRPSAREHRRDRIRVFFDVRCVRGEIRDRQELHELGHDFALVAGAVIPRRVRGVGGRNGDGGKREERSEGQKFSHNL